jgi:TetR/AcrR family transcriptional regulator, cholesterol catabolism regulator
MGMAATISSRLRAENTARYDKRLGHILRIAARLMARQGYERTSVRQVASGAKVALSGLYYYITGKEDLLFLIQFHTFDSLLRTLRGQLPVCESPEKALHAVINTHLDHFLRHMDELKVCARELETLTGKPYQQVLGLRREYFAMTLSVVSELVERNGTSVDPQIATLSLFGALNWIYQWYNLKRGVPYDRLERELTTLFLNALGSDERKGGGTDRMEAPA